MTYTIYRSNPTHQKAKYVGSIRINDFIINTYWNKKEALLYGVEGASSKEGYIIFDLIAYTSKELLDLLLLANDSEIYIHGPVLTYWEQYMPDEVEALKRVRYSTEEQPKGSRVRRYARSPKTTPEASLDYRINMLHSFVDDLPKQNIPRKKIVQVRANITRLQRLLKNLLELSKEEPTMSSDKSNVHIPEHRGK